MTVIRVQNTRRGTTSKLTCPFNRDVVTLIKTLPQRARRWDKMTCCWRIKASHINELLELLRIDGHRIVDDREPRPLATNLPVRRSG